MSSALVARLRHLESQVASLETTCADRVDALARACEALREENETLRGENEALRFEVARHREVDQTLLEGLLDDLAPVSSHDRVGDDGVDVDRAAFLHGWDEEEGERARDEGERAPLERAAPSVKIEPGGSEARFPSTRRAARVAARNAGRTAAAEADGDGSESESDDDDTHGRNGQNDDAMCLDVPRMYETAANGRQFLLCKHALKKAWCPECQPVPRKQKGKPNIAGSVCEHGTRRATCKTCKGGAVCHHNRRKYQCTLCFAERACEHGLDAKECADCVLLKVELAEYGSEDTFEDV